MAFLVDGIDFKRKYFVKQVSKNVWGVYFGKNTLRALVQSQAIAEQLAKDLNRDKKGGKNGSL